MVSRARTDRRILPRDEMVTRGRRAQGRHDHPWSYMCKVKSGTGRTENVRVEAFNLTDLYGRLIEEKASSGEDLFVWHVQRIMAGQCRSRS